MGRSSAKNRSDEGMVIGGTYHMLQFHLGLVHVVHRFKYDVALPHSVESFLSIFYLFFLFLPCAASPPVGVLQCQTKLSYATVEVLSVPLLHERVGFLRVRLGICII
jgi:hypothetical protein